MKLARLATGNDPFSMLSAEGLPDAFGTALNVFVECII